MRRLRSLIRRRVAIHLLGLRARWCLLRGRTDRACALLLRVVTLAPACFRSHLLLARVHLARGHREKALQELAICLCLDPARFQRQPLPEAMKREVEKSSRTFPDLPLFDMPPGEAGPLPGEWDDLLSSDARILVDPAPFGTDFVDADEYRRFRDLPPIDPAEVKHVDVDALIARLLRDPHPGGAQAP